MATLNIGGKRVKVDDSFLSLPPDQQQKTVDEIASQIGVSGQGQQAMDTASQLSQVFKSGPVQPMAQPQPKPDLLTNTLATIQGATGAVPFLNQASDALLSLPSLVTGGPQGFGETYDGLQQRRAEIAQQAPVASIAGTLGGSLMGLGAIGSTKVGAEALGLSGPFLKRMLNSGLSSGGLSMADSVARGNDLGATLTQGGLGAGLGAAVPFVGGALKTVAAPIVRPIAETIRGAMNPVKEASKAVGQAVLRDTRNVAAPVLSSADEAAARMNGQPILNVDRGGETTRALMRSAANQNPEARAIVEKVASDRFGTQSNRVVDFFQRVMGGNVDDLARKAQINAQKRATVTPAYRAANSSPGAQAIFTKPIQELLQSDAIQRAIGMVNKAGSDEAAIHGFNRVGNPFHQAPNGVWKLRTDASGRTVYPNLEFWDLVKRNLDTMIETAGKHTTEGRRFIQLKQKLVSSLDTAVPAYKAARGKAVEFFDAEDAVDAGRKAFASPKAIDESLAAFNSMTKAEKDDFGIGMVSQLMDDVRATNNRTNLMRMFDIPARKELMVAALGPAKAKQFEAFVRVEDIMDKVRGSLGNSTTARQLMELGIMGGLGAGAGGLNLATGGNMSTAATTALLVAAGRYGFRAVRGKVNDQVLQKVAETLASGNKAAMDKAISNAMLSEQHMLALQAIQMGIGVTARAGTQMAIAAN